MQIQRESHRRPVQRLLTAVLLVAALSAVGSGRQIVSLSPLGIAHAASGCQLSPGNSAIQHVIYIQFDNVHFTRDNPNVPSDLEQMPHLLNFIEGNGTMLTNNHTPLIAHTANDILTSLTGLYPDKHGVPIANSYRYFNPNGTSNLGVSFAYWTDPVYDPTTSIPSDTAYNMVTTGGMNTPAPWVPFTRAGCNVGSVATANTILENIGTDIPTVFGANSTQAAEVKSNPAKATADFVGIGIHCAQGASLCSSANGGEADVLPSEPYGYGGYNALFGAKYVDPQISPNGPLKDLNGNVIQDPNGNVGFPGFNGMSAAVSLSYVAAMQEHGVPVTYAYISDAHDQQPNGPAYGPGEAGYEAALKSYDNAFATFFTRLAADGINKSNTLFVITADENDHFVGGPPSPANCNGVTIPCTYSKIGEVNGNLTGLLATQQNLTTPFSVHADSAPNFYVNGNPGASSDLTRTLERAVGQLTAVNPYTGATEKITNYLADPVESTILHMSSPDAARNPTFTVFANPDYFLSTGAPNCSSPCITIGPAFAWNHGDVSPDINTTWLGLVGPGVKNLGTDTTTWADHTDIRPTIMTLLGLKDDYAHDGRALVEDLNTSALPPSLQASRDTFASVAKVYKQINAPVCQFGLDTLKVATFAAESNSPADAVYRQLDAQLQQLGERREALATQMISALEGAEFQGRIINTGQAQSLIAQGNALLAQADAMAAAAHP
jgi:hypothetical protein